MADAAFHAIAARLRAGATAAELIEASGVIQDDGFTIRDDLVHGFVGGTCRRWSAHSPPCRTSRSRRGMTVVVQPDVVTPDERAGVQTAELLLVTDGGAEPLHHFERGLLTAP